MELKRIVLASGSPRRSEILNSVGWEFEKIVPEIDETEFDGENPDAYVLRLAETKSKVISDQNPGAIVLGADTTVVIDGRIVGKPVDHEDARRMIKELSGVWHDVLTGIAFSHDGSTKSAVQKTSVKFVEMNASEIDFLVEFGEPLDKAGAYAVQAQAALFIERIEGDYWNVVGLPVSLVYRLYAEIRKAAG